MLTTASYPNVTPRCTPVFLYTLVFLFILYWLYGWFNCINLEDWVIENLLVIICLSGLYLLRNKLQFSDLSYLCIFSFVMLHLYGAFYAYTQNVLGEWLQNTYQLWRNPYDRIVHFSFGFFMAYPIRELLLRKIKISPKAALLLPVEICFSLGTVF